MDELVFRFLLDCGYPRASIVDELELLAVSGTGDGVDTPTEATGPDIAILDPETLERLAVFRTVGPLDPDGLSAETETLARFARQFGGHAVQGFLVRIDPQADLAEESVRFYRVRHDPTPEDPMPEYVPAHAVPDLDTLRLRLRLIAWSDAVSPVTPVLADPDEDEEAFDLEGMPIESTGFERAPSARPGAAVWLPGLVLTGLALADLFLARPVLDAEQALLAIGAGTLLFWAVLVRRR